jgi:rubrerythrin
MMNAMKVALKTETEAIAFYRAAARRTKNPVGRKMFLSIIEDEKRHLSDFRVNLKDIPARTRVTSGAMRKMKAVFERRRESLLERIRTETDELGALRLAMQLEKASLAFYRRLAGEAKTEEEKSLFRRLLAEEHAHYARFENTYAFLTDTGNWFLWEQHSIADGGTAWA